MRFFSALLAFYGLMLLQPRMHAAAEPDAGMAFFEKKIRPVLVEKCYQCHTSGTKQRGGLRLDSKDAVLKGGESGPAVVPGKPSESLLIKALRQQGPKMPPKGPLSDAVVADFARWIEMGAPDPRDGKAAPVATFDFNKARQFWSFQPPQMPKLPAVQDRSWPKNGIDHFIRARLESSKVRPVPPAGKRELIRRASFDLTGLPPTPEDVEAFVRDTSANAFSRVVDRLLASPHYGERWGRHWLDVARYAEDQAHTFGVKPNTSAFRYRDWVVAALNEDMSYDRFLKLQIAADLMLSDEAERLRHLPALGFFGLGAQYYKDNTEIVKALADELDERVDTLSRGLLGLTVACARCHDHKFDPVPTQDYYSLAGVFQSSKLTDVPLAGREEVGKYEADLRLARAAEGKLKEFMSSEKAALHAEQAGQITRYMQAVWKVQQRRQQQPKWSAKDQAKADGLHAATLERWLNYLNGNPQVAALDAWRKLPKPTTAANDDQAVLVAAQAFESRIKDMLAQRARATLDKDKAALLQVLFGDKGLFALTDDEVKAKLTPDKRQQMEQLRQNATRLRQQAPEKMEAKFPVTHALAEGKPGDMKIYLRGNPRNEGEVAPRRFLRVLAGDDPPRFVHGSGRLDLAEAVASEHNPLTARVMVNRVWQWHFGRGLVGTPSNFGALGERPTHPELLDYLACRFIESGWSLKALQRDIMLSATYQLGCTDDPRNLDIDADNRLCWRMNRRRLDVESWRDSVLAVSGKLVRTFGGPTTDLASTGNRRRTVYGRVSRHELNDMLRLFDFPDANITCEGRTQTTVPQQQLFVLNSPFIVEQARAFAARLQAEAGNDAERVRRAYALAFARAPDDAELQLALQYLAAADAAGDLTENKLTRWERLAQALLGSNEFMYVD